MDEATAPAARLDDDADARIDAAFVGAFLAGLAVTCVVLGGFAFVVAVLGVFAVPPEAAASVPLWPVIAAAALLGGSLFFALLARAALGAATWSGCG